MTVPAGGAGAWPRPAVTAARGSVDLPHAHRLPVRTAADAILPLAQADEPAKAPSVPARSDAAPPFDRPGAGPRAILTDA